jgi:hypothetical protein
MNHECKYIAMNNQKSLRELESLTHPMIGFFLGYTINGRLNFQSVIQGIKYSLFWEQDEQALFRLIKAEVV